VCSTLEAAASCGPLARISTHHQFHLCADAEQKECIMPRPLCRDVFAKCGIACDTEISFVCVSVCHFRTWETAKCITILFSPHYHDRLFTILAKFRRKHLQKALNTGGVWRIRDFRPLSCRWSLIFDARCYASAALAVMRCLSLVCPSVRHVCTFCQNE